MARVDAEGFAEKHARRLKGALQDVRNGIDRVTEAPTLKAAAKKDKMKLNLNAALDNGKWERGLKRVSLEEWKRKAIDKGIERIPRGIDDAHDKVVKFASELLPHVDAGKKSIDKLADVTLEDNINRMTTFIRHMSKFERKG